MADANRKNRQAPHWGKFLNRLNVILIAVFAMFAVLILRLTYIQLVEGDMFTHLVQKTDTNVARVGVPRGFIVDRNGEKLVDNEGLQAISYTRGQDVSAEDMAKTADNLAKYIDVDADNLTDRDKQDYFAAKNIDRLTERLSDEEKNLSDDAIYEAQIDKIEAEDLDFSDQEMEAAAIFKKMNAAYAFTPTFIKNEKVTSTEVALVSEHSDELPGVAAAMDWRRVYPKDHLLRSVLGNVTSSEEGLPAEMADYYLAKGYARNDRVGNSYLELEYEDSLRGSKAINETEVNQNGEVVRQEQTYAGEMGDTLVLTIDSKLQEKLEKFAEEYLQNRSAPSNNQIYIVLTNPNNGEVLAMVGKQRNEDGEIVDNALGTISSSFVMGSAVKGATVAAGFHYDIIGTDQDNVMTDQPMNFAGTPTKASWWYTYNRDSEPVQLDEKMALARSSNVYMIKLAMAIGGITEYYDGMSLMNLDPSTPEKLRAVYQQFGLGVPTGIDLQNESAGINGGIPDNPGNSLDLSFGQFDTYTTMALNQYVSTIANGGKRIAPHVMKEIRQGQDDYQNGSVVYDSQPEILNTVQISNEELAAIQEGFYDQVNADYGLGHSAFEGFNIPVAGKSGTAEAGEGIENVTWVGYAPYENPEVAVSIAIPGVEISGQSTNVQEMSREVLDMYFNQED